MRPTRRSTRGAAAKDSLSKQQSTLSFNHRVTKGNATKTGKDTKLSAPAPAKVELPAREEVEVVKLEEEQPEEIAPPAPQEPSAEKTEAQVRAEKISDVQIKRYWKGVEDARLARRVHQEELGLPEKVLRYFDVSSQYGPCIGVSRMKRWYRAERLGLSPPIEVLAILLNEEKQGNTEIEVAAIDRIMGSTAIGSV
ncbi:hypothetical protein VSDG_07609 [Cytospora chrysosperma]|uniref:DNA polymerase delta subunit 4 n=1 Tax=Cytospora chrysosperma TaxID=252740 RepID=A0A423VLQ4_CYTCH|nr:hypothetical protein VSDG_07609 [Valsa sordida]